MDWWKGNCGTYSTLKKVAKDLFTFPSSIVASENLGGRVVKPFRASLTLTMVEVFMCTSDWLSVNKFYFYKKPIIDDFIFYRELKDLKKSKGSTYFDIFYFVSIHVTSRT